MAYKFRLRLFCLSALLCFCVATEARAQNASQVNIVTLTNLYDAWLTDPTNEWVQKRIADERDKIREILEEETVETLGISGEGEPIAETDIVKSQERQRIIVSTIEERIRERNVDLDLLDTEEKKVYLEPKTGTGGKKVPFATTESHAELLAKKAVTEERIEILESLLPIQRDRMRKLNQRQWLSQFSLLINLAMYGLVIFSVAYGESYIRKRMLARIADPNRRYFTTKVFTASVYTFTILVILSTIFAEHPGIITSLAIVGAGIAVALQDVVKDFFGWLMIAQRNIFVVGDRVTIGDHTGEVIDIGVLRFKLLEVGTGDPAMSKIVLEHTGKSVSLPNAMVLGTPVVNHSSTSDYVKAEMRIIITFESDRKKAEEIITQVLQEETGEFHQAEIRQHAKRTRMYYLSLQPIGMKVYKNIVASGFEFTLRFSVPIGQQRVVISGIAEKIMDAFDEEPRVQLAYDTLRIVPTPPGKS